jgi:hypothetical protein
MRRSIPFVLAFGLAAHPAAALDVTGTWEGKFTCAESAEGELFRFPEPGQIFRISQTGNDVRVEWGDPNVAEPELIPISGVAIPDAKSPDTKGELALADCETSADLVANYGELARYTVRVNREKAKGSLKGLTIFARPGAFVGSCKASFKLVDPADPGVSGCP